MLSLRGFYPDRITHLGGFEKYTQRTCVPLCAVCDIFERHSSAAGIPAAAMLAVGVLADPPDSVVVSL